jgi:ubiquinone biosynthesis protein COQ4
MMFQEMQPLVALRALRRLINNPELTEEVFVIIRAMSGSALERGFRRFQALPLGRQILREQRQLLAVLQDRSKLASMPADSLGRAYAAFTSSEQITAEGLVLASAPEDADYESAELQLYGERLRDMHDLWHTSTSYGSDAFGEVCLLAFTYAQTRNRGVGIIAIVGMLKLTRELGASVLGAVWRAYRDGRRAAWLPGQDWESLLNLPLSEVRKRLRLVEPLRYEEALAGFAQPA